MQCSPLSRELFSLTARPPARFPLVIEAAEVEVKHISNDLPPCL
jgi:hypothetical protein